MDSLQKLTDLFRKFPGIGPRQARRFGYFLLTKDDSYVKTLLSVIADLKKELTRCVECFRFIPKTKSQLCSLCADALRNRKILTVVSTDTDLETFEKAGGYDGLYFVLGGYVPILEERPQTHIRVDQLLKLVNKRVEIGLSEVILALNANAEGEHTAEFLISELSPLAKEHNFKISRLGRGFSTGTELEYADPDTIKNAFKHRE